MAKSFSISFRLQRVTTETAYVSVPLTAEVLLPNIETGTATIDTDRLVQVALNLGKSSSTLWSIEGEQIITLHPIQQAPDTLESLPDRKLM
jgi:hypothetical protein